MRWRALILVCAALFSPPAFAQEHAADGEPEEARAALAKLAPEDRIDPRAAATSTDLIDPWRARYLIAQLDLSAERAAEFEPLINSIVGKKPGPAVVGQLLDLGTQLQAAEDQNDAALVGQLRDQIRDLMQQPYNDFVVAVRQKLNDEERPRFDAAVVRLEENPSGSLRPSDLVNVARGLGLSAEQEQKLVELKADFRLQLSRRGPKFDRDLQVQANMLSRIAVAIRELLTPEQAARFKEQVARLRVDLLPGIGEMDALAAQSRVQEPKRRAGPRPVPAQRNP